MYPKIVTYKDPAEVKLTSQFLSDEHYAAAIEAMVIDCTDAVIVDRVNQRIYLASRIIKPALGPWIIGGRRNKGEALKDSVRRHFLIDTKLDFPEERFGLLLINEYLWGDRQQEPQDAGSHNMAYTFSVELTEEERRYAGQNLNAKEYDTSFGLQPYDLNRLREEGCREPLVDMYLQLFR